MSVTLFSLLPLSVNRASALADQNDRCSEIFAVDATQRAVDCPSAPTGVRVLPADQGVEVSWDATAIENSVDDTSANTTTNDVNTATSFQVKLSPGDIVVNVAATSHTASVSGLMNGKVYEVTVVAIKVWCERNSWSAVGHSDERTRRCCRSTCRAVRRWR